MISINLISLASAFLTFILFFYNAFEGNRRISDHFIQFETKHRDYNRIGTAVVSHFYSLELGKFYKLKFSPTIRQKYLKLKTEIFKVKVFTNNKTEI